MAVRSGLRPHSLSVLPAIRWSGGSKRDGLRIARAPKQLRSDIKHRGSEHVVVFAELLSVQVDRCESIQPVEHKLLASIGRNVRVRHVEVDAMPELALFHPGAGGLVAIVEEVGDAPSAHLRAMDIAGYGDTDPLVVSMLRQIRSGDNALAGCELANSPAGFQSARGQVCAPLGRFRYPQ